MRRPHKSCGAKRGSPHRSSTTCRMSPTEPSARAAAAPSPLASRWRTPSPAMKTAGPTSPTHRRSGCVAAATSSARGAGKISSGCGQSCGAPMAGCPTTIRLSTSISTPPATTSDSPPLSRTRATVCRSPTAALSTVCWTCYSTRPTGDGSPRWRSRAKRKSRASRRSRAATRGRSNSSTRPSGRRRSTSPAPRLTSPRCEPSACRRSVSARGGWTRHSTRIMSIVCDGTTSN